jgi:hypothetical protein
MTVGKISEGLKNATVSRNAALILRCEAGLSNRRYRNIPERI